jgi:hypothetical protein
MSSTKKSEYIIERLCAANIADLEKLHAAVYRKVTAPGLFFKKYNTAFTGLMHTGFIAYNNNNMPIAFYGVIPCYINIEGKKILAAQSADTMTHPKYRNKGLFVELANLTFQLCRSVGMQVIFGFPNQNSLPGFVNKLGWQQTERMDCFIIPSGGFSWQMILRKLPFLKKQYKAYRDKLIKKYAVNGNGIANSVFNDEFSGVFRDEKYRNYKTYNKTYVIKVSTATVWLKINHELLIGDMLAAPGDFDEVIDRLQKFALKMGLKEIHFHTSPGTTLHGMFARRFKPIPSFSVIFKKLEDETGTDKIKFTSADIDTF